MARYPDALILAEYFRDFLSVKTEIYGIEIERVVLNYLDTIPEI